MQYISSLTGLYTLGSIRVTNIWSLQDHRIAEFKNVKVVLKRIEDFTSRCLSDPEKISRGAKISCKIVWILIWVSQCGRHERMYF